MDLQRIVIAAAAVAGALIAQQALRPEWPQFSDVAHQAGLTVANTFGGRSEKLYILESTGNGAAIFDADNDGHNDIFIPNGTRLKSTEPAPAAQLYMNDGHGGFRDSAVARGLTRTGWQQAACVADYDNDGDADLFVSFYGQNALYKNDGTGHSKDVSVSAGLRQSEMHWNAGCVFLDYDQDGWLDLFVANYAGFDPRKVAPAGESQECNWKGFLFFCGPMGLPQSRNLLYHNNHDGTFTDVSAKAGILLPGGRYGFTPVTGDFNGDGWPDIYVACDMGASLLYLNQKNGTFSERGVANGAALSTDGKEQAGMGVAVGDFDHDGDLDIVKTNFSGDLPSFYQNNGKGEFEEISLKVGLGVHRLLGWGVAFVDVDEDGHPDLVITNGHVYAEIGRSTLGEKFLQRSLIYRNTGNGRFVDMTDASGPAFLPERAGRGLAVGDLDGDGRPEMVIVNMNEVPVLLRPPAPTRHATVIRLHGTKSNRDAVGAKVYVTAGGLRQFQEVGSGGSFYSHSDFAAHFGLNQARLLDKVEIRWPSGGTQVFELVAADQFIDITEGEANLRTRPMSGRLSSRLP